MRKIEVLQNAARGIQRRLEGSGIADAICDRATDIQEELRELQEIATKAATTKAVVDALERILEKPELEGISSRAHWAILGEKREAAKTLGVFDRQLSRVKEIEQTLTQDAFEMEVALEASKRGCTNLELIQLKLKEGAGKIELDEDGALTVEFLEGGAARLNSKGEPASIGNVLDDLQSTDKWKPFFKQQAQSNDKNSSGYNPWRKETFSLMGQAELLRTNPERAQELRQAAEAEKARAPRNGAPNLTELGALYRTDPAAARAAAAKLGLAVQ